MLIGFMGIPGCGKSSTAAEIAMMLQADCYLEPEENEWSDIVSNRELFGYFSALMWFRNARVPGLIKAHESRRAGKVAVVDSLYDKLIARYIRDPSFAWLIGSADPYFEIALSVAEADYRLLPDPDILVFVNIDRATWLSLLSGRGRQFDTSAHIEEQFEMQKVMFKACEKYANERKIKLFVHDQQISSPEASAADIRKLLR